MDAKASPVAMRRAKTAAPQSTNVARIVALTLLVFLFIRSAWMGDDAFVVLRTALNATHGWGPGFNVTEVVQGYTSPLWFLLWILVEQITHWSVLGVLFLSVVLSALAVAIPILLAPNAGTVVVVTVVFAFSNAFFDFTSGGLENPLAYLLLGLLALLSYHGRDSSVLRTVGLGLVAAAVVLTRFDLVLMILPVGLWLIWSLRRDKLRLVSLLVAFVVPLGIWFTWSYATYASILPNTYLAKTNADIPRLELITQGILYLWVSLTQDPLTLFIVATFLATALVYRWTYLTLWAIGLFAYLLYVVWVGGDYMAGRFLSAPVFISVVLLTLLARHRAKMSESDLENTRLAWRTLVTGLLATGVFFGFVSIWGKPPSAIEPPREPRWDSTLTFGVADEVGSVAARGWTLSAFMESQLNADAPKNNWLAVIAVSANEWPNKTGEVEYPVNVWGPDCAWIADGIVLGPLTHQIVDCPLTDRFLAEMPFRPGSAFGWRPGHLVRQVPEGYVDAIKFGDPNLLDDPVQADELKELWKTIRP